MLYLIDHASHQGNIDMARLVREGHAGEIGKCTGEDNYVNPYYAANHKRAVDAGMVTGSYDWIEPQDARSGAWLAQDYLRAVDTLGGRPAGHLLTVDFETPDWFKGPRGRNIEAFMREYLYTLKDLAKQPVGVYTAPYFLQETGAINWAWLGKDFWYWMAAPGGGTNAATMTRDDAPWQSPLGPPWPVVTIHQHQWYAQSGAIGSGANFDRNRFNGTRAELMALGNGSGTGNKVPIGGRTVQEPPAEKITQYVNELGETIVVANFGGQAKQVLGANYQDLGVSIVNDGGEIYDRTIRNNEFLPWRGRR